MAYLRWSSKIRQGCQVCGDTGEVPQKNLEIAEVFPSRLCLACSSCWYVFWHCDEYIAAYHGACVSEDAGEIYKIDFEDAPSWEPACDCPNREFGKAAVMECYNDWLEEQQNGR